MSDAQEIHLWDKTRRYSTVANLNFFQLYIETRWEKLNVRLGRQGVLLDNGRIFSDAPWAQQSRSHEGARIMKPLKHGSADLFLLFTRKYAEFYDASFSPVASHHYKYLFIYHYKYDAGKLLSFNGIAATDVFEAVGSGKSPVRATLGGRSEFKKQRWYATINAYLQGGKTAQGKKLQAYYLQPELKLILQKCTLRLGGELLSGNRPGLAPGRSESFEVLYGVAWKFMGNMNLFTRFPSDVAGKGLVNPYLFMALPLSSAFSLRSDMHTFFTQYPLTNPYGQTTSKYLGAEHDLSVRYTPSKKWEVVYGFSYLLPSYPISLLPRVQSLNKATLWSYLMLTYTFNLADSNRPKKS